VTRQRVQQIEDEAMVKLRDPARCARLRDFV
jgi:DNA-directed RNA polymerase sigma subunit (sigma70/sigma32)